MQRPTQPQFKIRVYNRGSFPGGNETFLTRGGSYNTYDHVNFMDIEECVAYGVTYAEDATLLNTLSFTVDKHAEVLLHRMFIGQWVVLYGGFYASDNSGVRKVFAGTITRIKTKFTDSGKVSFSVEAMSYGFNQMGKNTSSNYVYPDKNSPRSFAKGKETLKLTELIRGIVESSGMTVGEITLPKQFTNEVLTTKKMRYQKDMSDWRFLNYLGHCYGCAIWTNIVDGDEKFYFIDKSLALNKISEDIQFLYPLQGESTKIKNEEGEWVDWNPTVNDIQGNEIQRFTDYSWNRPRILREIQVDEDISMAYSVSRSSLTYDKITGEEKQVISQITEEDGKRVITTFELDEQKVEEIHKKDPKLADDIRNGGLDEFPWSSGCKRIEDETPNFARYYYKITEQVDENIAVFDQVFFGITVSATCNQDLDIRSQRAYNIRGILRYNSTDKTGAYLLYGLKHIWDSSGPVTQLEFRK